MGCAAGVGCAVPGRTLVNGEQEPTSSREQQLSPNCPGPYKKLAHV